MHLKFKVGKLAFLLLIFILPSCMFSQALPIAIDSQFEDWTPEAMLFEDNDNDGNIIELLSFEVANDETHLFLYLELEEEINLTNDHKLTLYLDTDLNANTGISFNGIGAEVEIRFGEREVFYMLPSGQGYRSLNEINLRHQPSVTSSLFEIALDLEAVSNTGAPLFLSDGVRIAWRDKTTTQGDFMPNSGSVFTYFFDTSPTPAFTPILLEKENSKAVRLLSWNTLHTGLDDIDREPYFEKILGVIQPDIVTFNECWDINAAQVSSFMNAAVPLPNFQTWKTIKLDQGNITASRYPILQNWLIFPGHRLTASLIDIPNNISNFDLLVINAHLRCCENDYERQLEADAFVKFILDAKTPGGEIDLPEGTPFLLSGDLNLVGESQQLKTLLTGNIVNIGIYGPGGPMDWDGSDLTDVIALHSDDRMSYTWRNDFSSFPPSRIDYHITSNTISIDKSYTLEPQAMSPERLGQYNLGIFDASIASDHLPRVTDMVLPSTVAVQDVTLHSTLSFYPNPASDFLNISFETLKAQSVGLTLYDEIGNIIWNEKNKYLSGRHHTAVPINQLFSGTFFIELKTEDYSEVRKWIKQ